MPISSRLTHISWPFATTIMLENESISVISTCNNQLEDNTHFILTMTISSWDQYHHIGQYFIRNTAISTQVQWSTFSQCWRTDYWHSLLLIQNILPAILDDYKLPPSFTWLLHQQNGPETSHINNDTTAKWPGHSRYCYNDPSPSAPCWHHKFGDRHQTINWTIIADGTSQSAHSSVRPAPGMRPSPPVMKDLKSALQFLLILLSMPIMHIVHHFSCPGVILEAPLPYTLFYTPQYFLYILYIF